MLTEKQIQELVAPFPGEALTKDTSRGFELTSIKAAYIIERLNSVFGLLGCGWRYGHTPTRREDNEILVQVAFQYRCEECGESALRWDRSCGDWQPINGDTGWSAPIFAYGGNQVGKGGTPVLDAMKSAVTAGITKAASRLGVGLDVHKGLRKPGVDFQAPTDGQPPSGNGQTPVWEWESYWQEFSADDMNVDQAKKAGAVKLWFGKHQGKTVAEVDQEDKSYIQFLTERYDPKGDERKIKLRNAAIYRRACRKFLERQKEQEGAPAAEEVPFDL